MQLALHSFTVLYGLSPRPRDLGDGQIAIGAENISSLALTSDGAVVGWGYDANGEISMPASLAQQTVTAIAAGGSFGLALTSDGTVASWGFNPSGATNVPAGLMGQQVTAIAAGQYHSLAIVAASDPTPRVG
jgi:alpha-tubulin suppressor-like RCC1 family protein